jgi:hypothetical protein
MRKTLNLKSLNERPASRTVLALSLAASLAAFGCTTNRTPGNGEPLRSAPGAGPAAPTSGVTSGSSRCGVVVDPPMMSSSQHLDPLPGVSTRSRRLPLSPDEAAAIMADNQLGRGVRVLGPVNPARSGHRYVSDKVDPFDRPANGVVTVNSSINSVDQVAGIVNGATGVVGTGTTVSGVTGASTIAGTGMTTTGTPLTPTTAAIPVTPGTFAAGTGSVTTTTTPAVSASSTGTTLTPTTASSVLPSITATSGSTVTSPVRIVNTNGRVTVTNSSGGTTTNNNQR